MRKNNKKGFTIIELVIVIAVIAILAGVLIPTFSSVIQKARVSSDQQAIRQMNTALAAEGVTDENMDIYDMFAVLEDTGLSAKDYKALSTGKSFFWDAEINRVLYVDETGSAIYPAEYDGRTNKGRWYSLTQTIEVKQPEASKYVDNKVTVSSGAELAYVMKNDLKKQGSTINTIVLANDIDMMGASFDIGDNDGKLAKGKDLTIEGDNKQVVIKNATAVNARKKYANPNSGSDGIYNMGLVGEVASTLTIKNVTFSNLKYKDTNAGNCALLVGYLTGTLNLEDVVIEDSSIIGYNSVGVLVGQLGGTAKINLQGEIKIKNTDVQIVGGRAGKIFGTASNSNVDNINGTDGIIKLTNVTTGIYACAQNTGTCKLCSESLGLKGSLIDSWEITGEGKTDHNHNKITRVYYADSLVGYINNKKISANEAGSTYPLFKQDGSNYYTYYTFDEVKASQIYARLEALVA